MTLPSPTAVQFNQAIFKTTRPLSDLTPAYLKKNYLFGLDFIDSDGQPWPDDIYHNHLAIALDEFERETKVRMLTRIITNEAHDYRIEDYANFAYLQTYEYPIQSVQTLTAIYPTGQQIITFPNEWIKLYIEHGQIQLVPTQGSLSNVILGRGGSYLPLIYQGMGYLPQLWFLNYTVGFDQQAIPLSAMDCVCKLATISLLTVAADTIYPPGVTNMSIGLDGLSQGTGIINNGQLPAVFTGRINLYRKELYGGMGLGDTGQQGRLQSIKDQYTGVRMWVT